MKKLLIIFIILILFIPILNAFEFECNNTIFSDDFPYDDAITNHGWSFISPEFTATEVTIDSEGIFPLYSYGINAVDSQALPTSIGRLIKNISGKILWSFDYACAIDNDKCMLQAYLREGFATMGASWANGNYLELEFSDLNDNVSIKGVNSDSCTADVLSFPFVYKINVELDFVNGLYTLYLNNTAVKECTDKILGLTHFDSVKIELDSATAGLTTKFVDNYNLCEAIRVIKRCEFPSLFCDDFNYEIGMNTREWLIQLGGGIINNSFTPIDDRLRLQNTQNIFPYHETEAFETSYRPDSSSRFTRHELAPIFSSQFYLNMTNQTDNQFFYTAMQTRNMIAYSLKAEIDADGNSSGNMNWYYLNESQPSTVWKLICGNCTTTEEDTFIKINSLFAHRPEFPFNSSIADDEIHLYADYFLIGVIEDYLDARTITIKKYEFGKLSEGNYTIDDYYVMVGTDTVTPTFEQYYEDYYIDIDVINETVDIGVGTGDMAFALGTIWDDMGLLSAASRIMTGLFLMFLLALIMFGMALKMGTNLSAGVLILIEMFFMILLVYIKLLPIWLPFVIVLVAAGVGAAVIKLGTQT